MTSFFLNGNNSTGIFLERESLAAGEAEKWLQTLIHDHPSLLPMESIDPGSGTMIPLARELGCVFRAHAPSDSDLMRPPNPILSAHRFRGMRPPP